MILVCGLDRSGTSAVAGILAALGVDMGRVRQDVPTHDEPVQACLLAHGGHPRAYVTYEDEDVVQQMMVSPEPLNKRIRAQQVWTIAMRYRQRLEQRMPVRRGLKNNWLCLLGHLATQQAPSWRDCAEHVLMTFRPEQDRAMRERYYCGTILSAPGSEQLARWNAWLTTGYHYLRPHADLVVDYPTLCTQPDAVVQQVITVCALQPTTAQWQNACASIVRRTAVWPG